MLSTVKLPKVNFYETRMQIGLSSVTYFCFMNSLKLCSRY